MKRIKAFKMAFITALSFMFIAILCSCSVDLGEFDMRDDYKEYYESFGDIKGLYDESQVVKENVYDFEKSIFNDTIVEKLKWENDSDKVEYLEYCYIVIPFLKDMKIESIALYVAKDSALGEVRSLEFSAFYFEGSSSLPLNIKLLTSPDTKIVEEDDGEGNIIEKEVEIEYDDPSKDLRCSYAKINVTNNFDGFILEKFKQVEGASYVKDKCLEVKAGSFLYIRCENNSGLNRDTLTPQAFSFMNLLVRSI